MECEVCGSAVHSPKRVRIDGIEMLACGECAKLGIVLEVPMEARQKKQGFAPNAPYAQRNYIPHKIGLQPNPKFEEVILVDKFGMKIQQARQKLGWTREELAKKLYEKESTMHRIELSEFKPSNGLLAKIEKLLGIELKERED